MNLSKTKPLSTDQHIRLTALLIREAVKKGPDKASLSTTEQCMVAFATCDRQTWIPNSTRSASELWQVLNEIQRGAVLFYLNGNQG